MPRPRKRHRMSDGFEVDKTPSGKVDALGNRMTAVETILSRVEPVLQRVENAVTPSVKRN